MDYVYYNDVNNDLIRVKIHFEKNNGNGDFVVDFFVIFFLIMDKIFNNKGIILDFVNFVDKVDLLDSLLETVHEKVVIKLIFYENEEKKRI